MGQILRLHVSSWTIPLPHTFIMPYARQNIVKQKYRASVHRQIEAELASCPTVLAHGDRRPSFSFHSPSCRCHALQCRSPFSSKTPVLALCMNELRGQIEFQVGFSLGSKFLVG